MQRSIYAARKAQSVRLLRRTAAEIVDARGTVEKGKVKKPFRIVSGIVTYNSSWDEPFGAPLKNALRTLSKNQQIDFGISVDDGYFELDYKTGARLVTEFMKTRGLAAFPIRLLAHFQKLGTVSAIDYEEYSKILEPRCAVVADSSRSRLGLDRRAIIDGAATVESKEADGQLIGRLNYCGHVAGVGVSGPQTA